MHQKSDNNGLLTVSLQSFRHSSIIAIIAITLSACGGSSTEPSAPAEAIVITPTPVDNLPLAVADSFSTDQNKPLTVDLAANDTVMALLLLMKTAVRAIFLIQILVDPIVLLIGSLMQMVMSPRRRFL